VAGVPVWKGARRSFGGQVPIGASRITFTVVIDTLGIFLIPLLEIWNWTLLCLWLGQIESLEGIFYFSTVTFTIPGYGDITLNERWQPLSSFEAASIFQPEN
jgi:hypothetical protein